MFLQEVGRGPELRLLASHRTKGQYACVAKAPGFSPLEGRVHLRIRGPPEIWPSPSLVMGREGDNSVLRCDVTSVPHPIKITWAKDGDPILPGKTLFS